MSLRGLGSLRGATGDDVTGLSIGNSAGVQHPTVLSGALGSSGTGNSGGGIRRAHGFTGTTYATGASTSGATSNSVAGLVPRPPAGGASVGLSSTGMILGASRRHASQQQQQQQQPPPVTQPQQVVPSSDVYGLNGHQHSQQTHQYGTTGAVTAGNTRHGRLGFGLDLAALLANLETQEPPSGKHTQHATPPGATASQQLGTPPSLQPHANTARKMQRKGSASSSQQPLSARTAERVQSGKVRGGNGASGVTAFERLLANGASASSSVVNPPTVTGAKSGAVAPPPLATMPFGLRGAPPQPAPQQHQLHQLQSPRAAVADPLTGFASPRAPQDQPHNAPLQMPPNDACEVSGGAGTTGGSTMTHAPPASKRVTSAHYERPTGLNYDNIAPQASFDAGGAAPTAATAAADPEKLAELDGKLGCMTPLQALEKFEPVMSRYERKEIVEYAEVYFVGVAATKIDAPVPNGANYGFDDERGDYVVTMKDHIAYRYEVVSELGKGSFGQVLKVLDHKKGTACALKIIRNKKRFHQQAAVEIRILDHLRTRDPDDRSCTVRMLNYFKFRSHTIITFEMHSMNLYELTKLNKYQPFAPALIKRFTAQILVAMSFMWREHIVHCDLKPENILLRYENKTSIKIIDFGSSCFETERIYTYIQSRFYRAPEIILGLSYGRPIDTWSLGCIVAEMQIGYPIFPGENEKEQLLCIMEVLGVPPPRMVERSPRKKEFFDNNNNPKLFPNSRNKVRKPATKDIFKALRTDDASFVDFVLCFLQWEPTDRITPTEAMRHPWVAECFQQDTVDASSGGGSTYQRPQRFGSAAPGGPNSARGSTGTSGGLWAPQQQQQQQQPSTAAPPPVAPVPPSAAQQGGASATTRVGGTAANKRLGSAGVLPPPTTTGASSGSNLPSIDSGDTGASGSSNYARGGSARRAKGVAPAVPLAPGAQRLGGGLPTEISL